MLTDTALPLPPHHRSRLPRRGPIRRIVASSLGIGAATAVVLVLVVFAGAREHVITGSALLGFALGWTVLAVLSGRLTDQPQNWAFVPAAVMAATGLGLLVLAPDDGGLTAGGWVWPPALLALAGWMAVRVRRALAPGSGRWLLYPVIAAMALTAVGGMAGTVTLTDRPAMPGERYDVGGHRLHLDCAGSGGPTVVLLNGLGQMSATWNRVVADVSVDTRVCAYDRAGQGWSDAVAEPQDGLRAAADLHALLDRAGEQGPYVLAGHSTGGTYAMAYAARYPADIAGLVLLDPANPYAATASAASTDAGGGAFAVLPSLFRLGVGELLPETTWSSLPEPAATQVAAFASAPRDWRTVRDETAVMPKMFSQAQALTSVGSKPVVVVTTTAGDHAEGWSEAHDRMAALSSVSSHRFADVTHVALLDEADGAATSADAIGDVVGAAVTGSPLPAR